MSGHDGVVKVLLERGDINPNHGDTTSGSTPLSLAAEGGHEGVVKMLLAREDINPNKGDTTSGFAPLLWAAWRGQTGVVNLLLEREDINPDQADTASGRTPLSWAAGGGHDGVVKVLLERGDINPNKGDTISGSTPLVWAAWNGKVGAVKLLLERQEINPSQADTKYGRTPLSWAAERGDEGVVKMLSERINASTTLDNKGRTSPSLDLSKGSARAVQTVPEPDDANSDRLASLPPSDAHGDCVLEMQFRVHDPNCTITGLDARPTPPPGEHDVGSRVMDPEDLVSKSEGSNFSTEVSRPLQTPSICPITPPAPSEEHLHPF